MASEATLQELTYSWDADDGGQTLAKRLEKRPETAEIKMGRSINNIIASLNNLTQDDMW